MRSTAIRWARPVIVAILAAIVIGCASVTSSEERAPTPAPRAFMSVPVKEQTFTDDAIRSWQFRRDVLPITEGIRLEDYLDPELFGTPKADDAPPSERICDFSVTGQPRIKGDIDDGSRLYYAPNDPIYDEIAIDEGQGERWFCTERDALNAGWNR